MIRNGGSQTSRYYVWINNICIIYKSIRTVVIPVGCKITGINDLETRESKNSLSDYAHYN